MRIPFPHGCAWIERKSKNLKSDPGSFKKIPFLSSSRGKRKSLDSFLIDANERRGTDSLLREGRRDSGEVEGEMGEARQKYRVRNANERGERRKGVERCPLVPSRFASKSIIRIRGQSAKKYTRCYNFKRTPH